MKSLLSPFFLLIFALCLAQAEERTWTNIKGKTIKGIPVKKNDTSVTIRLSNGKTATISLNQLSQEDQAFTLAWAQQPPSDKPAVQANFNDPWPTSVRVPLDQEITLIKEEDGLYTYETKHFSFVVDAKVSLKLMKTLSSMFEATLEANCALPLNFHCRFTKENLIEKFPVILYSDRLTFQEKSGADDQNDGLYSKGVVHVPFDAVGIKKAGSQYTIGREGKPHLIVHEITHQMTLPAPNRPGVQFCSWFAEGIAEYVGFTTYRNGTFNFGQTKQNLIPTVTEFGRRGNYGRGIGKDFQITSLKKFITQSYDEFYAGDRNSNYGIASLLFYYFCHIDGKGDATRLKKYVQSLQEGKSTDEAISVLLDGRTWSDLAKEVEAGMKKVLKLKPTIGE